MLLQKPLPVFLVLLFYIIALKEKQARLKQVADNKLADTDYASFCVQQDKKTIFDSLPIN